MSSKNHPAVKAARRAEREERKSAKVFSSNYSFIKNSNMEQSSKSGSATKDPKEIKIGISFFMTFVHSVSTIDYTTDLDRFTNTYNHVRNHPVGVLEFRRMTYERLMELINSNAPVDEYFYTIGMYYLVTFDSVKKKLESLPHSALGFMIEPIKNDADRAMVIAVDYDSWEYSALTRTAA